MVLVGLLAGPLSACVIELPEDAVPEPCDLVVCSTAAYCDDGRCVCEAGHAGNPDAAHGCQPTVGSACTDGCGAHASCDAGTCLCDEGYVATCGGADCLAIERVCDGIDDCADGADEDPMVCVDQAIQEWVVTDACLDGYDVQWRVWSLDRDWVWPSIDDTFWTVGLDVASVEPIECIEGELLCFGGESGPADGPLRWGIGLDGAGECDDCCAPCAADVIDVPALRCD